MKSIGELALNNIELTEIPAKKVAKVRVRRMLDLAKRTVKEDEALAQRYADMARRIGMKTNVRIPEEYRPMLCRKCKRFIYPGLSCRVRIRQRREPHVAITCLYCGGVMRRPLSLGVTP